MAVIKKQKLPFSLSVRFPAASVDVVLFVCARFCAIERVTSMFKRSTYACGSRSGALQVML